MARTRRRTHLRTTKRRRRSQPVMRGGGARCDRWRTKLAVLQSKLALRHRYKGFERLAKQIYKAYLEVVTLFCNDRFRPSDHSDRKLQQATASLSEAYRYRLISHKDYSTAVMKMTTAMSGVRGATARRLVREIHDDGIAANRTDRDKFLKSIQTGLKKTHQYPIELNKSDDRVSDTEIGMLPARNIQGQRIPIDIQGMRQRLQHIVDSGNARRARLGLR